MKFAYYPGCSARSTCAELNEATHLVANRLGLDLVQLDSATCTGARELRAIDPPGFYALNVRILALAERQGLPLMTICNTCTLNLLDAHAAFVSDPELAEWMRQQNRSYGTIRSKLREIEPPRDLAEKIIRNRPIPLRRGWTQIIRKRPTSFGRGWTQILQLAAAIVILAGITAVWLNSSQRGRHRSQSRTLVGTST